LESTGALLDPEKADAEEQFEEELGAAAAGDWEKLGIDPPDMVSASIEELRDGG
jgi:hypothetical protein